MKINKPSWCRHHPPPTHTHTHPHPHPPTPTHTNNAIETENEMCHSNVGKRLEAFLKVKEMSF